MNIARMVGMGLVALAIGFDSSSAGAEGDPHVAFAGSFRFAGDANEQAVRKAAIEKAIGSLFFAVRPIARSRMEDGTRVDSSVRFEFGGGNIRVKLPKAPDAISPESGATVTYVDENGDKSRLSQRIQPSKVLQTYATDDGARSNDWSLSPDGNTLKLNVVVSSPKLSAPVVYTLTYKKAP